MDLNSLLNDPTSDPPLVRSHSHHSPLATAPGPPQPPNQISTSVHNSPQSFHHQAPPGAYASPTAQYHPAQPHPQRDFHAVTPTSTNRASLPSYSLPSPSPYPLISSQPSPYQTIPQHSNSHPSVSPTTPAHTQPPHSLRESPVSQHAYPHSTPINQVIQHPPLATPLGPPISYQRPPSHNQREPPSPYSHQQALSGPSYGAATPTSQFQRSAASPGAYDSQSPQVERNGPEYPVRFDKERSVSVSPKTKVPSRQQSREGHYGQDLGPHQVPHPAEYRQPVHDPGRAQVVQSVEVRHSTQDQQPPTHVVPGTPSHPVPPPPPQSLPQTQTQQRSVADSRQRLSQPPVSMQAPALIQTPPTMAQPPSHPSTTSSRRTSVQSPVQISSRPLATPAPPVPPSNQSLKRPLSQAPNPARPKRKRNDPPPPWAQRFDHSGYVKSSLLPNQCSTTPAAPQYLGQPNGHAVPPRASPRPGPTLDREIAPSITNMPPYNEATRKVCDFLWDTVVCAPDNEPDQRNGSGLMDWQFEIEAKLGQLVDPRTNQRLDLPILSETVLRPNSSLGVRFQSSMTQVQHKKLNEFLNKECEIAKRESVQSRQMGKFREAIDYQHRFERDTFYELDQGQYHTLPDVVRRRINPKHKTKVRVTTNSKTGEVIAKIVKVRIADLDLYLPSTPFDCRFSVNAEVTYNGDVSLLQDAREDTARSGRSKDRLSYRHQCYSIDLTQVTPIESGTSAQKTHELEIEVNPQELLQQGELIRMGNDNRYEKMVEGLVNNVRVLARAAIEPPPS